MEFIIKHYNELTRDELYSLFKLRIEVFVVEQNCPYQDADELDFDAYHLWISEGGELLAYCRILPPGAKFDTPCLSRVISAKRGMGYGAEIVNFGIREVKRIYGHDRIKIQAQQYAEGFYNKCGFKAIPGVFPVDNIPHVEMHHGIE